MADVDITGTIEVLPFQKCRVLINQYDMTNLFDVTCTATQTIGSGSFTAKCMDRNQALFNTVNVGDEVEIFMNEIEVENKVWGGYLESKTYDKSISNLLTLSGRDYTSRLLNQYFTQTYSAQELSVVVKDIMTNQSDFTTVGVGTTSGKAINATYTKRTLFDAIKTACDQWNYIFQVDMFRDMWIRDATTVVAAGNALTWGDNVFEKIQELSDKTYIVNKISVEASASVSGSGSDATSQGTYGIQELDLVVPGLTNNTDATAFASTYIQVYKDPITNYKVKSRFLNDTIPGEYITCAIPNTSLETGSFLVIDITHTWSRDKGLCSETTLGTRIMAQYEQLGDWLRRYKVSERRAFIG
jgi:hypothetical protein